MATKSGSPRGPAPETATRATRASRYRARVAEERPKAASVGGGIV